MCGRKKGIVVSPWSSRKLRVFVHISFVRGRVVKLSTSIKYNSLRSEKKPEFLHE